MNKKEELLLEASLHMFCKLLKDANEPLETEKLMDTSIKLAQQLIEKVEKQSNNGLTNLLENYTKQGDDLGSPKVKDQDQSTLEHASPLTYNNCMKFYNERKEFIDKQLDKRASEINVVSDDEKQLIAEFKKSEHVNTKKLEHKDELSQKDEEKINETMKEHFSDMLMKEQTDEQKEQEKSMTKEIMENVKNNSSQFSKCVTSVTINDEYEKLTEEDISKRLISTDRILKILENSLVIFFKCCFIYEVKINSLKYFSFENHLTKQIYRFVPIDWKFSIEIFKDGKFKAILDERFTSESRILKFNTLIDACDFINYDDEKEFENKCVPLESKDTLIGGEVQEYNIINVLEDSLIIVNRTDYSKMVELNYSGLPYNYVFTGFNKIDDLFKIEQFYDDYGKLLGYVVKTISDDCKSFDYYTGTGTKEKLPKIFKTLIDIYEELIKPKDNSDEQSESIYDEKFDKPIGKQHIISDVLKNCKNAITKQLGLTEKDVVKVENKLPLHKCIPIFHDEKFEDHLIDNDHLIYVLNRSLVVKIKDKYFQVPTLPKILDKFILIYLSDNWKESFRFKNALHNSYYVQKYVNGDSDCKTIGNENNLSFPTLIGAYLYIGSNVNICIQKNDISKNSFLFGNITDTDIICVFEHSLLFKYNENITEVDIDNLGYYRFFMRDFNTTYRFEKMIDDKQKHIGYAINLLTDETANIWKYETEKDSLLPKIYKTLIDAYKSVNKINNEQD